MILAFAFGCVEPTVDKAAGDTSAVLDDTGDTDVVGDDTGDTSDTDDTVESGDTDAEPGCGSTCDCGDGELCYEGECAAASDDLGAYRRRIDAVVAAMDASGGYEAESAYPTEALMTLASAAEITCEPRYRDAAVLRASFARSWENSDHLLDWDQVGFLSRDYIARHIYNLWAAGHALDDPSLLAAADEVAIAMMGLDRQLYKDEYLLFCTTFHTDAPYGCEAEPWIDVNQNSEVGMAFALLAADPDSALFGDATAIDIADNELAAAFSAQTALGEIPIGASEGYEDDYDTLYGSYAAFSWAVAASARPDDTELAAHLALASDWLAPYSDGDPESHRTYPYPYDGPISLSEGSMRLPVLASQGVLDPAFVDAWWAVVDANTETYSTFIPAHLMQRGGLPLDAWIRRE